MTKRQKQEAKELRKSFAEAETKRRDKFASADIFKKLGGLCPTDFTQLDEMKGATVEDVGFVAADEGGFTIDYIRKGETTVRRVVLGFTELGMWVEYLGPRS